MTVWFTSDPHWGHRFVASLRGFEQTADHDIALLENFHSMVKEGDVTWWLGDLAMNAPDYALSQIATIPGRHHLITGNHDKVASIFRDAHRWQRQYLEVFDSVQAFARRRIAGQEVLLSHYPYLTDAGEGGADHTFTPRYTQYRLPDEGRWLLHGHTHNKDQRVHGKQIHVGLDAWDMRPVNLDQIQDIVERG